MTKAPGPRRKAEPKVNPLLLLLGAAGLSAAIYVLGTQPTLTRAAELSTERQALEEEVAKQQAVIGQLPRLRGENEQLKLAAIESKLRFPKEEQFGSLVRDLNLAARNNDVIILSMKRTVSPSSIPGIDRLEINADLRASYANTQAMIQSLQERQRYIGAENISFATDAEGLKTKAIFAAYMLRAAPSTETTETQENQTTQGGN